MRDCTVNVCIFWQKSARHGHGEVSISGKSSDEGFTPCNISSSKINISLPYYISAGLKQNIENKSIPLSSMINGNLKEHDKVMLGANTNTSGQTKGPWNHIYTSNISPASALYASEDNGYTKLSGFSWPPRLYVCSFCKREFRSAQALGGHMNVHRRDRARLRQSPPASPSSPPELVKGICPPMTTVGDSINLNLIPNPNPNLVYSSAWVIQKPNSITSNCITHSSTIPSPKPPTSDPLIISSSSGAPNSGTRRWSVTTRPNPFASSTSTGTPNLIYGKYKKHHNIPEGNNNKAIEKGESMRLGFSTGVLRKEEVDLELRLGYSS